MQLFTVTNKTTLNICQMLLHIQDSISLVEMLKSMGSGCVVAYVSKGTVLPCGKDSSSNTIII